MPTHTLRLLVSAHLDLKPFTHVTLLCADEDKRDTLAPIMKELGKQIFTDTTFIASEVVNFGTAEKPIWVTTLSMNPIEQTLRKKLSELLDKHMSKEKNGVLYHWLPKHNESELREPHITIGNDDKAKETAEKLVAQRAQITFSHIDYKQIGPHDPIISLTLCENINIPFSWDAFSESVFMQFGRQFKELNEKEQDAKLHHYKITDYSYRPIGATGHKVSPFIVSQSVSPFNSLKESILRLYSEDIERYGEKKAFERKYERFKQVVRDEPKLSRYGSESFFCDVSFVRSVIGPIVQDFEIDYQTNNLGNVLDRPELMHYLIQSCNNLALAHLIYTKMFMPELLTSDNLAAALDIFRCRGGDGCQSAFDHLYSDPLIGFALLIAPFTANDNIKKIFEIHQHNKRLIKEALQISCANTTYLPDNLLNDKAFIIELITTNPCIFKCLSASYRNDYEILIHLIKHPKFNYKEHFKYPSFHYFSEDTLNLAPSTFFDRKPLRKLSVDKETIQYLVNIRDPKERAKKCNRALEILEAKRDKTASCECIVC